MSKDFSWWQHGVVYQIYPRSFQDTNRDGVGDLPGIIQRLDYLVELGVDAIWLSPIFRSPMADFGYDVADYCDIDPLFGTMADFDRLLSEAHARDLKIILDYVPNHTSDEHRWFVESRSSKDNPRRDWYIWQDPAPDGGPPNNWESFFGGPAWTFDEATGQYYLHLFDPKQPDLNWRHPAVVEAMHDVLRFWLEKGVDGFRMDVITFLLKHPDFPDNPPVKGGQTGLSSTASLQHEYDINQPGIHELLKDLRRLFDAYDSRVIIGETLFEDPAELVEWYGDELDEIHIPFNFITMWGPWEPDFIRDTVETYFELLPAGAVPNFVIGNHDRHRPATRYGYQNHRSAGLFLLTMWGVPTMYYGDELGMERVPVPPEKVQDPWGKNHPDAGVNRDEARTPMQWDDSPNAGFCPPEVEPWLPLAPDYEERNVAAESADPTSTLNFYKRLLALRRQMAVLHRAGDFAFVDGLPDDVLAYTRTRDDEAVLVVINFGGAKHQLDMSEVGKKGEVLLSTVMDMGGKTLGLAEFDLRPHEGVLLRL